jgi:arylsulfatase
MSNPRSNPLARDPDSVPRHVLPIPERLHVGPSTYGTRRETVRPPDGAPHVLLVLLDDVGFGASSTFGGPCETPAIERLASGGLKFTRFHTTPQCSPTRQALLTGRNHHSGAPLPDILKHNGYASVQLDKADAAIEWMRANRTITPDKPLSLCFVPELVQPPRELIDAYKGRFDQGWDRVREETLARQRQLGVIPAEMQLTARPADIPAWEAVAPEVRPVFAAQMEHYAATLTYADQEIGRVLDAFRELGLLDDTLVYVIVGNNGADDREPARHYAVGWAHAMDTPYQWTPNAASHFGGTRNGMVAHWPRGIAARGELRHEFCHVVDILPTVLDAAGLPEPISVDGVEQHPIEGVSMLHAFGDPATMHHHDAQYFEMFGASTSRTRIPWQVQAKAPADDAGIWELYATNSWMQPTTSVFDMKNRSHAITAEIEAPTDRDADGVIVAQGGISGGWSLYAKSGTPKYCYNFYGLRRYYITAASKLTPGRHLVRMELEYDGGGLGKGGTVRLFVDGEEVGSGRVDQTEPFMFCSDETLDVGRESGSPVTGDYSMQPFNGEVTWVELDLNVSARAQRTESRGDTSTCRPAVPSAPPA